MSQPHVQPLTHTEPRRSPSPLERGITIVLLVGLLLLVPVASFLGLFFGMASDGCMGDAPCDSDQIGAGVLLSAISPVVVFLAALVGVAVRMVRGRTAWWVPLVALAVGIALWALGGLIAVSAVG